MKKLLVLSLMMAFITVTAVAQDGKAKYDRTEWEKKIKDELKLTPEQTEKFTALNKEYDDKIDAVKDDASLSADLQKEKKMSMKKEKEAKMMLFLTPEQQTKYKELMDKKKKEMEAKNGA